MSYAMESLEKKTTWPWNWKDHIGHQTEHVAVFGQSIRHFLQSFVAMIRVSVDISGQEHGDMTNFVCRQNRKPNVTGNGALCVCSNSRIDKILIKTDIKWRPFSFTDSSRMRNSPLIMTANRLISFRVLPCIEVL